MRKITAEEFKQAIKLDPSWASKLTEDVEITTFCNMAHSKITHLSKHLHFTGKDRDGFAAGFSGCKNLKIAEGNFQGAVYFGYSGIEKIDPNNLKINGVDKNGDAASFSY